jgi:dTDP-4-dehydrorhamnose reductase
MQHVDKPVCLLFGANGQVGFELCRSLALGFNVVALARGQCDLSDAGQIRRAIQSCKPSVIVNAAAYTAVDKAESEPVLAQAINAEAVAVMAQEAKALSAVFLHYSTDYVFNGEAEFPYRETDPTDPINAYGRSKLAGETAMSEILGMHSPWWIIRTSWVYGRHGNNFLKTMLKLAQTRDSLNVVADQIGAPTSATLIAEISARLLQVRPASGIYHLTGSGQTSWHGFAKVAISHARKQGLQGLLDIERILPIPSTEYPTPAKRPADSRLNCTKLEKALLIKLPDWQQTVEQTVNDLLETGKL